MKPLHSSAREAPGKQCPTHRTITVDHDTLTDNKVTIRDRDTMQQERVAITDLDRIVSEKVDLRGLLSKL